MSGYYGKNGECRMYDGGTPKKYISILFSDANISIPEGHARPEEIVRSNRGQLNTAMHYIQGPDDVILQPINFTMSFKLDSVTKDLVHEFIGIRFQNGQDATWNAGSASTVLVTTKGTSAGLRPGLVTPLVVLPLFTDPSKVCVNVETLWDDLASVKTGRKVEEVYFDPQNQSLNESMDAITINLQGSVYGPTSVITAFTGGTELTA